MIPKRPLLSATIEHPDDLASLQFPILCSEKKDGIRGITSGTGCLSRTLKPIPNRHINSLLSGLPAGIEGELIVDGGRDFEATESGVMTQSGKPDFKFHIFDWLDKSRFEPFKKRYQRIRDSSEIKLNPFCERIIQLKCDTIEEIQWYYNFHMEKGAEGIMIRDPNGFYKFGRSTLNEQLLIKFKPWNTDEAEVIEVIEEFKNCNLKEKDERGLTKRSKHLANLQGKGTMGALRVRSKKFGEFKIGSGFTQEQKEEIWDTYIKYNSPFSNLPNDFLQYRYRGLTKYGTPKHAGFVRWI